MLAGDPAFVCNESKLVVLQVSIAIKKERKRMTYADELFVDIVFSSIVSQDVRLLYSCVLMNKRDASFEK